MPNQFLGCSSVGCSCALLPTHAHFSPLMHTTSMRRFKARMEERKAEWALFPEQWRVPQVCMGAWAGGMKNRGRWSKCVELNGV